MFDLLSEIVIVGRYKKRLIQTKDQLNAAILRLYLHNCIDMQMICLRNHNLENGWEATLKGS